MPNLDGLRRDVRDALRALARRPGFTLVAVFSPALGIGADTAIFSLVNAVMLRTIPIDRPEEMVNLYLHSPSFGFGTLSYPDYKDVRDGTADVFSQIGAAQFTPVQIDGANRVDLVFAEAVSPWTFSSPVAIPGTVNRSRSGFPISQSRKKTRCIA